VTPVSPFVFCFIQLIPFLVFWWIAKRLKINFELGLGLLLCLYFVYNIFVPIVDHQLGIHSFFGYSVPIQFILHLQQASVYALGLFSLLGGYLLCRFWLVGKKDDQIPSQSIQAQIPRIMVVLQTTIWGLIIFNVNQSGISLFRIFDLSNQNESEILFSVDWKYPVVDLLSNCLPVCLFLQFRFSQKIDWKWIVLFCLWLIISLLTGWRYRIILFSLIIGLHFLINQKVSVYKYMLVLLSAALVFSWLTLNRMAIAKRQFDLITFNISKFDIQIFTNEFSNSRTFRATQIYLAENPQMQKLGYSSWIHFISNKFKPKSNFPNQERPKPWILKVTKAWIPAGWLWNPNPAVTQMEEFFLTFNWLGLLAGMCFVGFWAGFLDSRVSDPLFQSFKIIGIALLFQWTTRGFFLYQIQITIVCFLPFLLLWLAKPYLSRGTTSNKA